VPSAANVFFNPNAPVRPIIRRLYVPIFGAKRFMGVSFRPLKFWSFEIVSNFVLRISKFWLKSVCLKHLTLCQIITYEKQTPKFSTIQAIWRTIGAISRAFRVLFESDSRAIRDNWRYFETKHEKIFPPLQSLNLTHLTKKRSVQNVENP